jgi:hypothetical protein
MRLSRSRVTHASTLETGTQFPDVHCAPLGIRKRPLIPISDHGNERLYCFHRQFWPKIKPLVTSTGDETVTEFSYPCVSLGNRESVPGVLCAPLGAREEPSIPITDHGNGRRWGLTDNSHRWPTGAVYCASRAHEHRVRSAPVLENHSI